MGLQFGWNKHKAASNIKKHKIGFNEAITVFDDPLAAIFDDEDHSEDEHREIIIGYSSDQRLLLVSFTERDENNIRIISARLATKAEQKAHEESHKP